MVTPEEWLATLDNTEEQWRAMSFNQKFNNMEARAHAWAFYYAMQILHGGVNHGIVCVDCSHPANVEWQRRVFHPAYRGCVLQGGVATEREDG